MDKTLNFAVVEFTDEQNVEVVPYSFLTENNTKCFWPKRSTPNLSKLLSKNEPIADSRKYDKYGITVISLTGKLINSILTSTINV